MTNFAAELISESRANSGELIPVEFDADLFSSLFAKSSDQIQHAKGVCFTGPGWTIVVALPTDWVVVLSGSQELLATYDHAVGLPILRVATPEDFVSHDLLDVVTH